MLQNLLPSLQTAIRAAEGFVFVLIVSVASQVTVGGQTVDLSSSAGRAAAVTALGSALLLALRRSLATNNDGAVG